MPHVKIRRLSGLGSRGAQLVRRREELLFLSALQSYFWQLELESVGTERETCVEKLRRKRQLCEKVAARKGKTRYREET